MIRKCILALLLALCYVTNAAEVQYPQRVAYFGANYGYGDDTIRQTVYYGDGNIKATWLQTFTCYEPPHHPPDVPNYTSWRNESPGLRFTIEDGRYYGSPVSFHPGLHSWTFYTAANASGTTFGPIYCGDWESEGGIPKDPSLPPVIPPWEKNENVGDTNAGWVYHLHVDNLSFVNSRFYTVQIGGPDPIYGDFFTVAPKYYADRYYFAPRPQRVQVWYQEFSADDPFGQNMGPKISELDDSNTNNWKNYKSPTNSVDVATGDTNNTSPGNPDDFSRTNNPIGFDNGAVGDWAREPTLRTTAAVLHKDLNDLTKVVSEFKMMVGSGIGGITNAQKSLYDLTKAATNYLGHLSALPMVTNLLVGATNRLYGINTNVTGVVVETKNVGTNTLNLNTNLSGLRSYLSNALEQIRTNQDFAGLSRYVTNTAAEQATSGSNIGYASAYQMTNSLAVTMPDMSTGPGGDADFWRVPVGLGTNIVNANMDGTEFEHLAAWCRLLVTWITALLVLFWFYGKVEKMIVSFGSATGMDSGSHIPGVSWVLSRLLGVAASACILWAPVMLAACLSTDIKSVVHSNPLSVSGQTAPIVQGIWLLYQWFPLDFFMFCAAYMIVITLMDMSVKMITFTVLKNLH